MQESKHLEEKFQKALDAIKKLKQELNEAKAERNVPIALIGMSCRYPNGADTTEKFMEILLKGENTVTDIPEGRWNIERYYDKEGVPGKMNTKRGSFLDKIDLFDNAFFDVPPVEAEHMDPQLRMLMMVAHEALENAGVTQSTIKGTKTGIFIGSTGTDYALRNFYSNDSTQIDTYALTGVSEYSKAGRIAYFYDTKGPCVTVNTACSSSLSAFHLACQSLRNHESEMAITGGANIILSPHSFIALSQMNALSKEGISRTFDKDANGYSRGEGIGIVILKRLSDAVRDNDNIIAVMRGSASNQDGRSNGFTAPNGASQEKLIRTAIEDAGLTPEDIDYIETHGTGTSLGDPIELSAIKEVFAKNRNSKHTLYVGGVKTNVGHTESAAGVSGIIKTALALKEKKIFKHLHFETPNPYFDWKSMPIEVSKNTIDWPLFGEKRRAGISSFGVSGTNIHVILEEAPIKEEKKSVSRKGHILTISAQGMEQLKTYAKKYIDFLNTSSDKELGDICANAVYKRTHYAYRVAVSGESIEEIKQKLSAFASGELDNLAKESPEKAKFKSVFVFPGQGSQWIGMGRKLYNEEEFFKNKIDDCEKAFSKFVDWSLVDELNKKEGENNFDRIDIVQPVLFAIDVALASLWQSWGVVPQAVIGHSMGEVAAAHIAEALTLDDAACIICSRSKLMRNISGKGAMAVLGCTKEEAEEYIKNYRDKVSVAVSNSPKSTVISGDTQAIQKIIGELEQKDVFCRQVNVDVASHSPQVDELKDELLKKLKDIKPQKSQIPMYSTVLGKLIQGDELNANYWLDNLRKPVNFYQTIEKLVGDKFNVFIETSPHPVLQVPIEQITEQSTEKIHIVSSVHKESNELTDMLQSFGLLHAIGYPVEWKKIYPEVSNFVQLPTYPWQLKRFWIEAPETETVVEHKQTKSVSSDQRLEKSGEAQVETSIGKQLEVTAKYDERYQIMNSYLKKMISNLSGKVSEKLDDELTFTMIGIDSLILMKIRRAFEKEFNRKFPVKIFWTNSTISKLTQLILSELGFENVENTNSQGLIDGWFDIPKPNPDAKMKLFCFHPAGGTSSMFHSWTRLLDDSIEMVAIELPGRGSRTDEEAIESKEKLVEAMMPAIVKQIDRPFIFFGHCMGGLILYEVVRKLRKENNLQPEMIIISASPHPDGFTPNYKFHLMSDLELGDLFPALKRENFGDDEYYNLMLRIMRADIQLGKMYEFLEKDAAPVNIPMVLIGPKDDELAEIQFFKQWEKETTAGFQFVECTGGHHYINNNAEMLTTLINKQLAGLMVDA